MSRKKHNSNAKKKSVKTILPLNKDHRSITHIEDFSNELFYEVFDHLDGCDIFEAFSNLNNHFKKLVYFFPLKIDVSSKLESTYEQIRFNVNTLISLRLMNTCQVETLFDRCVLNESLSRLESLVLDKIAANKIKLIVPLLNPLPRLYSLTIIGDNTQADVKEVYPPIFSLPVLKYAKLSLKTSGSSLVLPIVSIDRFSNIEHLSIDDPYDLAYILSHTPRLCRLTCKNLSRFYENTSNQISVTLPNLTHLIIDRCSAPFEELEAFIQQISSPLQLFRFIGLADLSYLNADRWKKLINNHMRYLRKFEFHYDERDNGKFVLRPHRQHIRRFMSPFWIERQCLFIVEIDIFTIRYSIYLQRKRWYNLGEHDTHLQLSYHLGNLQLQKTDDSSNQVSQNIEISIKVNKFVERYELIIQNISSAFTVAQISNLNIVLYSSFEPLVKIVSLLSNLQSLKVSSSSTPESFNLSNRKKELFRSVSSKNKITQVNLEKMYSLKQIDFLIELCPQMKYLQLGLMNDFDIETNLQFILMKIITDYNHRLPSLCLILLYVDNMIGQRLQKMIDHDELLSEYRIKRVLDRIYVDCTL